jgi:hypothetical protein
MQESAQCPVALSSDKPLTDFVSLGFGKLACPLQLAFGCFVLCDGDDFGSRAFDPANDYFQMRSIARQTVKGVDDESLIPLCRDVSPSLV